MAEILQDIRDEASRILENDSSARVGHHIIRAGMADIEGFPVELLQYKMFTPEDVATLKKVGAKALATPEWFSDVDYIESADEIDDHSKHTSKLLLLQAEYPLKFFKKRPYGLSSEKTYLDNYWSFDGSGDSAWGMTYVDSTPGSRQLNYLKTTDPEALATYNARFRDYLDVLKESDPTIWYSRRWWFDKKAPEGNSVQLIGGVSLEATFITQTLVEGAVIPSEAGDKSDRDGTLVFLVRPKKEGNPISGYNISIPVDGEPTIQDYWANRKPRPASNRSLKTALALLRNMEA